MISDDEIAWAMEQRTLGTKWRVIAEKLFKHPGTVRQAVAKAKRLGMRRNGKYVQQ